MSRTIAYKTSPDPVSLWLIVPGFGQMDPVRKQAGVQEPSGPLLANASQLIRIGCESDLAYSVLDLAHDYRCIAFFGFRGHV